MASLEKTKKDLTLKNKIVGMFHKIFEPSHLFFTTLFFLVLIMISFVSISQRTDLGNFSLFISIAFSLTFLFMFILTSNSKIKPIILVKEKVITVYKILGFIIPFMISFALILIYFLLGASDQIPIQFLGWDLILPAFCVVIYFAWNLTQIFFIKTGFENFSNTLDRKVMKSNQTVSKKNFFSHIFVIFIILSAILVQLGIFFGFLSFFGPQTPGDSLEPIYWFYGWNIFMCCILILLCYRLVKLHLESIHNSTPNLVSSTFFILIWLLISYRSFSFIYSFRSAIMNLTVDIFRIIIDILLMIFTAIMALRGLGSRVYKFPFFNNDNLPFFLFAFTILYLEGQVIMIVGGGSLSGFYSSRNQINLANNFLVFLITVIFYWYYSKYLAEKRGLISKRNYSITDVYNIVFDFKEYLVNTGALEPNKVNDFELKSFLSDRRIKKVEDGNQG
jgi:hypothetical protein